MDESIKLVVSNGRRTRRIRAVVISLMSHVALSEMMHREWSRPELAVAAWHDVGFAFVNCHPRVRHHQIDHYSYFLPVSVLTITQLYK